MVTLDNGVVIDESLTAKGYTAGAGQNRTEEFITIHHWGVLGQTHDGVCNFFVNGPGQTSPGYVASDGRVNCLVSDDDIAWHAGTWEGNRRSIGIECRPEATDGDYETVASLIRYLRSIHGDIPLVPHNYWYNTECPGQWDLIRLDALARNTTITIGDTTVALTLQELQQIQGFANANGDRVIADTRAQISAAKQEILVAIKAISTVNGSGASLDLAAIAKAVADEEAKRLAN